MKKILPFILLLLIAALLGSYFFLNKKTTILTNLMPPRTDIKELLPQGGELSYPLTLAPGYQIGSFADLGGSSPRVLTFDPEGVLVASLTSSGRVVALPDRDKDNQADEEVDILTGLNQPHGLVFYKGMLYVAETDGVSRYQYDADSSTATEAEFLFSLPTGGGHFTRTIGIYNDKIYASVGSSCNVCIEKDERRSAILISELDGANLRVFAKGLRNTVFFTFDQEGRLWGTDMGRDFLGDNLPPDELNLIEEGKDYGWPYCYGNKIRDTKFMANQLPNYCEKTEAPKYEFPAHIAPLGIAIIEKDILVAFHGSWNSSVPVGYKVISLKKGTGNAFVSEDFISGFLKDGQVLGRPVGLLVGQKGELYISDDKANAIYIVTKTK